MQYMKGYLIKRLPPHKLLANRLFSRGILSWQVSCAGIKKQSGGLIVPSKSELCFCKVACRALFLSSQHSARKKNYGRLLNLATIMGFFHMETIPAARPPLLVRTTQAHTYNYVRGESGNKNRILGPLFAHMCIFPQ